MRWRVRGPFGEAPVRRLALESAIVSPEASFDPLEGGSARVVTPPGLWHQAVGFPVGNDQPVDVVLAVVACRRGAVGVGVLDQEGAAYVGPETMVAAGETRMLSAELDSGSEPGYRLVIRNGAAETASECDVLALFAGNVPSVTLTDAEVALALRNPLAARESCAQRVYAKDVIATLGAAGVPLRVEPPRPPYRLPAAPVFWRGPIEKVILESADDLISLLDEFQPEAVDRHIASLPIESIRLYLRMNVVRVLRLVELLRRRGVETGRVLEIGAWFGSFALALRRLGFDVVACDRYSSYGNAFASHVELMHEAGVRIVSTSRENELDEIGSLGQFDIVLAGAVIEHVPHTPRYFLETLFGATRPRGVLLLDTPNVARYWNRRALGRGETIFQPLKDQYFSEPPWEGHHREYTAAELMWILEQVGCEDVEVEFVDYNMLQFEELTAEHTDCLARIVEDPSQSDTLLAAGRRPID